eukprot:232986-Amphidinium_carterae.1
MNASGRSGLDAWRRLSRRFDANSSGRKRTLLRNVLQPGSFDNQQLRQAIEQHERLVRDFERRRPGSDGVPKQVDEDIRIGILQEMVKDKTLQDHLYLQPLSTYAEARQVVMDYLALKVSGDDGGVAPMDVGSLNPGKGKGKGGKSGKDKGAGAAGKKEKDKSKETICWNCGKVGHRKADCWAAGGGAEKPSGNAPAKPKKGKGKGKTKAAGSLEEGGPENTATEAAVGAVELASLS